DVRFRPSAPAGIRAPEHNRLNPADRAESLGERRHQLTLFRRKLLHREVLRVSRTCIQTAASAGAGGGPQSRFHVHTTSPVFRSHILICSSQPAEASQRSSGEMERPKAGLVEEARNTCFSDGFFRSDTSQRRTVPSTPELARSLPSEVNCRSVTVPPSWAWTSATRSPLATSKTRIRESVQPVTRWRLSGGNTTPLTSPRWFQPSPFLRVLRLKAFASASLPPLPSSVSSGARAMPQMPPSCAAAKRWASFRPGRS